MNVSNDLTGAIGFSSVDSFFSRLIRWATNSRFSHVFIVTDDNGEGALSVLVLEAKQRGVFPRSFATYVDGRHDFELWRPKLDRALLKKSVVGMYKHIDKPYSFMALVGIGISIVASWFSLKIPNIFKWGQICSETGLLYVWELISNGLGGGRDHAGSRRLFGMKRDDTTPELLYEEIRSSGLFSRIDLPSRIRG